MIKLLVLLILSLLFIALLEAPRLVAAKMHRELLVFLSLWSFASFIAIAQFLGIELPNPTELISAVFSVK